MFTCSNCNYSVERRENDVILCPQCGSKRWVITMHVKDKVIFYDELGATLTNDEGDIVAERIQKTDLNTSANLTADMGKPSKIAVERKERVTGFEEEGAAAEALLTSYNKLRNTSYKVEIKAEEDCDYADRIFTSPTDDPVRINIQISHLDPEIIADIGKHSAADALRTAEDVITSIRDAIDKKAKIDQALKANTILLLRFPAPLGEAARQSILATTYDCKGFKEIWISPFHEESFALKPT